MTKALEDLVQITTYNFKPELREENYWLLFAPIRVERRLRGLNQSLSDISSIAETTKRK